MSSTETPWGFDPPLSTCWVPAGTHKPAGQAQWWEAVDGSGALGYSLPCRTESPWQPLTLLSALPGASHTHVALYHYVVETDIPAAFEHEFNNWYEQEHLPGLARVEGTVCARRFKRVRGAPLYMACYDLVTPDAMTSPAWLAVRGTPWSDRVRPLFENTRRTLFARLTPLQQP